MRHLLIVGKDLDRLLTLSLGLPDSFQITTVAVADDPLERAFWSAIRTPSRIIVSFEGRYELTRGERVQVRTLVEISPIVVFLVSDTSSSLSRQISQEGGLVLGVAESSPVIAATLLAYDSRASRI